MPLYELTFDTSSYRSLDDFALLSCQDYNLGNHDDWFGEFRGGLYGFYARLHAVRIHYRIVHAWLPVPRSPTETEYHLTSIIFGMDSAVECLTFALNALGFGFMPADFRSISDDRGLRAIHPKDVAGDATKKPPIQPQSGYSKVFPSVQGLWSREAPLLTKVIELHDVSKHRQTIYVGGMNRTDPPSGFYEALDIGEDPGDRALFWPSAEIILKQDPKSPAAVRTPQPVLRSGDLLEDLALAFVTFIERSGDAAISDARANIRLNEPRLRTP